MAIGSRAAISNTQVVLPKHEVEQAGSAGQSKRDGKREQARSSPHKPSSQPISNEQGHITGLLIDVTV